MIRSLDDFEKNWKFESDATKKVFGVLTDASLAQKVTPTGRSLGFLAWHVATTIPEMMGQAGVTTPGPSHEAPAPATAAEIASAYEKASEALVASLRKAWTDAQLTDIIPMYGDQWPKGIVLQALMNHQAHHRGQMTVLMRQAGLKVPGVYGPAAEEWAAFGMPVLP